MTEFRRVLFRSNEISVGKGLQRAIDEGIVTREEVFITTKMWTADYGDADDAINASLSSARDDC